MGRWFESSRERSKALVILGDRDRQNSLINYAILPIWNAAPPIPKEILLIDNNIKKSKTIDIDSVTKIVDTTPEGKKYYMVLKHYSVPKPLYF